MIEGPYHEEINEQVEIVGICDECGNMGLLRESEGSVLCQSCYNLAEDFEKDLE